MPRLLAGSTFDVFALTVLPTLYVLGVAALVSVVALLRYADRLLEERAGRTESIFPSPQ